MINTDIRALISDYIVLKPDFNDEEFAAYQNTVTELTAKIFDLLPRKIEITYQTIPDSNRPLWLWHSGRKAPQLAIYQEVGTYFSVVNGFGTIEMDKSVSFESATYFMYINRPEEFIF